MNAADIDQKAMQRVASDAVQMLKELANENRLMIMCALSESELSVGARAGAGSAPPGPSAAP